MIIARIKGGLGNQFFVYATAYALSKKFDTDLLLDPHIYLTSYKLRDYSLTKFNIGNQNYLVTDRIESGNLSLFFYKVLRKIKLRILNPLTITEKDPFELMIFEDKTFQNNLYLDGYWQNYRYFNNYKEDLQKQFIPNKEELSAETNRLKNEIIENHGIVVHVRRGDYITFKGGSCLDLSYYKKSIDHIRRFDPTARVYFFSDDINYIKENFNDVDNSFIIPETFTDIESFYLMSQGRHFVISNSTFSWWAAYLSNYQKDSIIVAPVLSIWKESFYPDHWIKVKANTQINEVNDER